jgi:hypothetical protein
LGLLVPTEILAAVLLWRRAPWGYVLATVTLLFGAVYQLNYMTALIFQPNANVPGATSFDRVEPYIAGAFAIGRESCSPGSSHPCEHVLSVWHDMARIRAKSTEGGFAVIMIIGPMNPITFHDHGGRPICIQLAGGVLKWQRDEWRCFRDD